MKKNILLILFFAINFSAYSQNDLCQNAISLTPNSTCNYTSATFSGSSISSPAPSCALNSSQDIWYSFVATDPTMSIKLQATSGLNHAFEIFESSCTGTSIVCTNESSVSFSEFYMNNNFIVGQAYYVRVLNTNTNLSTANFAICVQNYPNLSYNEFNVKYNLSISPNPVKNSFFINSDANIKEILIYDFLGKKINNYQVLNSSIDVSDLKSGIYIVKLITIEDSILNSKFLKL